MTTRSSRKPRRAAPKKRACTPRRSAPSDRKAKALGRDVGRREARAGYSPAAVKAARQAQAEFRASTRHLSRKERAHLDSVFANGRIDGAVSASAGVCSIGPKAIPRGCVKTVRIEIRETGFGVYGKLPEDVKRRALAAAVRASGGRGRQCKHSVSVSSCLRPRRLREDLVEKMYRRAGEVLDRAGYSVKYEHDL
jgi:hypothetical protein